MELSTLAPRAFSPFSELIVPQPRGNVGSGIILIVMEGSMREEDFAPIATI